MKEISNSESYEIYKARISEAAKFIYDNLENKLDLNTIAEAAHFSPFHFHRLFSYILKETPLEFVNRMRLEKAKLMLAHRKNDSVTQIALACGFSSSAAFARAFRKQFSTTPTHFRNNYSKIGKTDSKGGKALTLRINEVGDVEINYKSQLNRSETMNVEVKHHPKLRVAYVSLFEGYDHDKITALWEKLCGWAGPRGLLNKDTKYIGVSYDDPDITPADKCRYDACVTVPDNIVAEGGVSVKEIPAGTYASFHYEGPESGIKEIYESIYGEWLPNSGYQPADTPGYEYYLDGGAEENKFNMDIYVPVVPL